MAGMHTTRGLPKNQLRLLGHYALIYITKGSGELRDDRGLHRHIRKGDLILVFPDISHTYGPYDGQLWDEIWVVFNGPIFDLWRESNHLDPASPVLHLEPIEFWSRQFIDTVWSVPDLAEESALIRVCRLQQFIADAQKHANTKVNIKKHVLWLAEAKQQLEVSGPQRPNYHEVAEQLGLSYDNFRKKFAKETGLSPDRYYNRYRINQVCKLLTTENLTLREIAYKFGFSDEYHLSKRFKQTIGLSPSEYRNFFFSQQ